MDRKSAPVGIFDSGVGGLSVLQAIRQQLPRETLVYMADQEHVPYGLRSLQEVQQFSEAITRFLIVRGAKAIVVACNTASAAALHHLRRKFPAVPFVGMEPAVKPAAEQTRTGVVGVLATPATFQGALYASVIERFAKDVRVLQATCPGLVDQIEQGGLSSEQSRSILEKALKPMLSEGIDTIVLGCTHFPFVIPLIQELVPAEVRVIDPAPAVARQLGRILTQFDLHNPEQRSDEVVYYSSGDWRFMQTLLPKLINESAPVHPVTWSNGRIHLNLK